MLIREILQYFVDFFVPEESFSDLEYTLKEVLVDIDD